MSHPVPLRRDFSAARLRGLAKKTKDGPQARRLLTLAAIYDGATRSEAAKIGGVGSYGPKMLTNMSRYRKIPLFKAVAPPYRMAVSLGPLIKLKRPVGSGDKRRKTSGGVAA
jgi:hypothetical protein